MAAHAEPSLNALSHGYSRHRMLAGLQGCAALLVVVAGVLSLLDGSRLRHMLESWINVHALFGLLLCGLVFARCQWCVMQSPCMLPTDIRELSRHLSRIVYLLLYLVIGVRLGIDILDGIWHGSAVEFNLMDDRFRHGPDRAGWNPRIDFQLFLGTGLLVLIMVRILVFRLRERAAASQQAAETDVMRVSKRR